MGLRNVICVHDRGARVLASYIASRARIISREPAGRIPRVSMRV